MAYKDPLDPRNRAAKRKHYHANKQQYYDRRQRRLEEMTAYVRQLKSVPCADCGGTWPYVVMDFDHRDPSVKVAEVSVLLKNGSWNKLLAEIEKCDVVCSNCHRLRTWGRA